MRMIIFRTITAVCLSLVLVLTLTACSKRAAWQKQYDLGMRYLTECNYEEAIIAFTAAIEIDPKQTDTYVYLAQAYLASGDPETAQQILMQGYDATNDSRLDWSSEDGWFLYNSSLAFDQQLAYRDFNLLSAYQQTSLRQAIAAVKQGDEETALDLLKKSRLPIQLFTELDGEQIQVSLVPETDNEILLKAYKAQIQQEISNAERDDTQVIDIEKIKWYQFFVVRPENGIEYRCADMEVTYGVPSENEIFYSPVRLKAYQTTDCVDGEYNGNWSNRVYFWPNEDAVNPDSYFSVESSGYAEDGELITDGPSKFKLAAGEMAIVYEYQGDEITAIYVEDLTTGERVGTESSPNQLEN